MPIKSLYQIVLLNTFLFIFSFKNCTAKNSNTSNLDTIKDTTIHSKKQVNLIFEKVEQINASWGTKSVLFNTNGTKLYAMNLEGMSVFEFNQATKKITKEFKFSPTKGMGWDYTTHTSVPSYQEKPVEACFSNNDKILWVSLHNAAGIVPIRLDSTILKKANNSKKIYTINKYNQKKDSTFIPLITTGNTPKVIAKTSNDKFLLVSNWHSNTISVLSLQDSLSPFGKVIQSIKMSAIPRGIAIDDKKNKSYIAIMGGNSISVIDNNTWKIEKELQVASNPRHIILDSLGRLFVSFNSLGQIACIDPSSGKTLFKVNTNAQPRTIVLSKNQNFLFVTCYSSNMVDVFKINNNSFTKIYSLNCKGKPVGWMCLKIKIKLKLGFVIMLVAI
jgi:DNA-binding beta-propeller fold protein YncE